MKNGFPFLLVFAIAFSCTPPAKNESSELASNSEPSDSNEQTLLFNQTVDNWYEDGNANWEFIGGHLIGNLDSGAGFVISKDLYKDFILTLEFNPDSTINSGVFVRCKDQTMSAANCYEINIWDLHPNQDNRTGAVVARATPLAFVESLNKWNTYEIRCEGSSIKASINGVQTVDLTDEELSEGFIGLQAAENGMIRFRNIKVQPIN